MKTLRKFWLAALLAVAFAAGAGMTPMMESSAWAKCNMGDPACTP